MKTKNKTAIKLLALLLGVFMIVLTGCNSAVPTLDDVKPWGEKNKLGGEESVYAFSRYITNLTFNESTATADDSKDKGYLITQNATLTYTLNEGYTLAYDKNSKKVTSDDVEFNDHTLLKMELTVTYKNDLSHLPTTQEVKNLYAGKTDTIISYTVLNRYNLNTLFTYKNTDIKAQADGDNQNYTLTADYVGGDKSEGEIGYFTGEKKVTVTDRTGTKTSNIKNGTYYDSESVYYRIRALSTVTTEGSAAILLAMPYDDAIGGITTLKARNAQQATAAQTAAVKLDQFVYSLFDVADDKVSEDFELDCYKTTLSLATTQAGHGTNLYFASANTLPDYAAGVYRATKKVLVKIEYTHNERLTGLNYMQEYLLTSYTNQ